MHVGVARPVDVAVLRVDERPALEDVADRLVERDQGQQDRDVRLHGRSHPGQPTLGLDPPVEVVEHHRDRQGHDQDGQRPVHDEGHERQVEDVEADVLVELGVRHVEAPAVAEEDPVVPLSDGPRSPDQRQHEGEAYVDPPGVGAHELLVATHQLVLLGQHDVATGDAVADHEVHPQDGKEDRPEDAEEAELDRQERREDVVQVHGGEPQAVGVETGQGSQRHQEDDDDDDEADEPPPRPVPPARRGISSQVAGDAHVGSLTSAAPVPRARLRPPPQSEVLVSCSPAQ